MLTERLRLFYRIFYNDYMILFSFEEQARSYRESGQVEIAETLDKATSRRRNIYQGFGLIDVDVIDLPESAITILKRGLFTVSGMLCLAILVGIFNIVIAASLLIFTIAMLQMIAFALWIELRVRVLNPTTLMYSTLFTIALGILVLSSLIIV